MAIVLEDMLQTIKDKQWALADVDWDAPGAEQITAEQRPKLFGVGQEGPQRDARGDLSVLPCRGAKARECGAGIDAALGHA